MAFQPIPLLISCSFGDADTVNSTRYDWDNRLRGSKEEGGRFVIIQHTVSGLGLFDYKGKTYRVEPGNAFIAIAPEESRYYYPKEGTESWEFTWINFYGELGCSLMQDLRNRFGPVLPLPLHSPAGILYTRLNQLTRQRRFMDPFKTSSECFAFMTEWVRQLTFPSKRMSDPVSVAVSLCIHGFRDPLGVKELAEATGLSREHLTRLFTQKMGISPARFLRNLRLEAAREILSRQENSYSEAALRSGFPSVRSLKQALAEAANEAS